MSFPCLLWPYTWKEDLIGDVRLSIYQELKQFEVYFTASLELALGEV